MSRSDTAGPEAWLAARLAAGRPAETWKPLPRIDGCAFSRYEASDAGGARTLDWQGRNGRFLPARELGGRPHRDGYILDDYRCDDPARCPRRGRHTFTRQKVVLSTFDKPRPRRMQGSHLTGNPVWNWFPEGLAWEDQPANELRKHPAARAAAARKARAAQLASRSEPRLRWWQRVSRHLPWSRSRSNGRPITAGPRSESKPVTKVSP